MWAAGQTDFKLFYKLDWVIPLALMNTMVIMGRFWVTNIEFHFVKLRYKHQNASTLNMLWLLQRNEGYWEQSNERWRENGNSGNAVEGGQAHCWRSRPQVWGGKREKEMEKHTGEPWTITLLFCLVPLCSIGTGWCFSLGTFPARRNFNSDLQHLRYLTLKVLQNLPNWGGLMNLISLFQRKQERSTWGCFLNSVRNVSLPVAEGGTRWFSRSLPTQAMLWFCELQTGLTQLLSFYRLPVNWLFWRVNWKELRSVQRCLKCE